MTSHSILGFHEPGGEYLFGDKSGWTTFTHVVGEELGFDYTPWTQQGTHVIARLNHGYYPAGTIPPVAGYADFALRCASWVSNSQSCHRYIIGNEPNHSQERPGGVPIPWQDYLECFLLCYDRIKAVDPGVLVLPAPVAPWNPETGNWLEYQRSIVSELFQMGKLDGGVIHAYTHQHDPEQVTVDDIRHGWQWEFRTYRDQAWSFPPGFPLYITECNPVDGWDDEDRGWMVAVHKELREWNEEYPDQEILSCCFYRWPLRHDQPQWAISTRPGVIQDFKNAVALTPTPTPPPPPPPPPPEEDDMQVVLSEGFEHGSFPPYEGQTHLLVPEGWHPDWIRGEKPGPVRPEIQPEDKDRGDRGMHSGRFGSKLCHAYSFFDGVLYRQARLTEGMKSQARGWTTVESGGGMGCQIGIDPTGGTDFRASTVQWSDWWGTDYPEFDSYIWRQLSTPVVNVGSGGLVTIFLRTTCRHPVQVNAGFWDDVELLANTSPTPPPPPPPPTGSRRWRVDLHVTGTIEEAHDEGKGSDE